MTTPKKPSHSAALPQDTGAAEPAGQSVPAGQALQVCAPGPAKVPAGQSEGVSTPVQSGSSAQVALQEDSALAHQMG
jgi:hypothetical protein